MGPAPSNSLGYALAVAALAGAGAVHEYLPPPPPAQNSLFDWVHTRGEAAPFLELAGRFSRPESLAPSIALWGRRSSSVEHGIVSALPDVSRVVIWPKFPDPDKPASEAPMVVSQSRGGVLGNGAAAPALHAAQRNLEYLRWPSVAVGALIAVLATQGLGLAALAIIPGLLAVATAGRLFASLGGPSTLASLAAHAATHVIVLIASLRVVRACSVAREEDGRLKGRITLGRVCAWLGASAAIAASLLLSDVPAVQQFAGTLGLGLALGLLLVAALLPPLVRPARALGALRPVRNGGLPRWLELTGLVVFCASFSIIGARVAYDVTADFNRSFMSLPIVQYYWPTVKLLAFTLPTLGLWLGVPLALSAGLRGVRHARGVFAQWFPVSAERNELLTAPWQVLGVLSLVFIVAGPRLHRWVEGILQPHYPTWLAAPTVPPSDVEAFEVAIDAGAPGASAEALQRLAHFGRALESLPGLRARIDPALLVSEASRATWGGVDSTVALSRASLRRELVPAFDTLISTDGQLLRSTVWVTTTPERTARQIASELEALLARQDWGFSSASVTGTWQLKNGLVSTRIVVGVGVLGLLFALAGIAASRLIPGHVQG